MADIRRKAYTQAGTPTSALTTELNSLANAAATAAGTAQDNSTNKDLWAIFVLSVTFGTAPTAGATVDLYILPSADGGTNYADAVVAATPARGMLVGSFSCRAVTTAQVMIIDNVPIPEKFKMQVVNNSGQAFPASGSTVKYQSWKMEAV
jgi:hypothetical protein